MPVRGESSNDRALRDTMPPAKRPPGRADICDSSNEDVGGLPCPPIIDGTAASSNGGGEGRTAVLAEEDDGEEDDEFVPLSTTRRRKRGRDDDISETATAAAVAHQQRARSPSMANEQMPEVAEEVHQVRTTKRRHALVTIKATPEYMDFDLSRLDVRPCTLPRTPDAEDRTVSKRRWQAWVMRWRRNLRQWSVAGPPVVATRPRWADICDSSNEDVGSLLLPRAPVIDSHISYMEVGGSRSDLTQHVEEALDLKGTAASSNGGGEPVVTAASLVVAAD